MHDHGNNRGQRKLKSDEMYQRENRSQQSHDNLFKNGTLIPLWF